MPAEPCKINCGQCQRGNPIGLEPALDFDAIYLRRRAELTKAVGGNYQEESIGVNSIHTDYHIIRCQTDTTYSTTERQSV